MREAEVVVKAFWKRFQKDVPGVPMMTTAKNYQDFVEDYEYLQLAAAKAGVEACDNVTKTIVRTRTDFSRSPEELRKARELLSTIITNGR